MVNSPLRRSTISWGGWKLGGYTFSFSWFFFRSPAESPGFPGNFHLLVAGYIIDMHRHLGGEGGGWQKESPFNAGHLDISCAVSTKHLQKNTPCLIQGTIFFDYIRFTEHQSEQKRNDEEAIPIPPLLKLSDSVGFPFFEQFGIYHPFEFQVAQKTPAVRPWQPPKIASSPSSSSSSELSFPGGMGDCLSSWWVRGRQGKIPWNKITNTNVQQNQWIQYHKFEDKCYHQQYSKWFCMTSPAGVHKTRPSCAEFFVYGTGMHW